MHIDSFFACSNSSEEECDCAIFGIPYDQTQSFKPGSRFAPTAIREASWNFEDFSLFFKKGIDVGVCDFGNVCVDGKFEDVVLETKEMVKMLRGKKIVMIGGEHTVSYALSKHLEKSCFVVFDAHFDMRNEFDGSIYNHACTVRRIMEKHEVVLVGVRSCTKEELEFAESEGVEYFTSFECLKNWEGVIKKLEKILPDSFYVSVDVDAFDPAYAPGVSTPEPFGLKPLQFLQFLENFRGKIEGMDVVEVIPDSEKITPSLAAKLIIEFLCSL